MINFKREPDKAEDIKKILNPLVREWFFKRFKEFSEPQLYGIKEVHSRNNILISAPTGGTKTLTAFLAILNELVDSSQKGILENKVYCVYVSPLKALGNDIQKNLIQPLKEMEELNKKPLGINIFVRTGDTSSYERTKMLKNVPHILITTPETLSIVLNAPRFREKLKDVQWIIVDEIHSLAENKRGVHLSLSIERLQRLNPGLCRVGLSATIAPLEEVAKFLVGYEGNKLRDCKIVDVQFLKQKDFKVLSPVKDLIDTPQEERHNAMYNLLNSLIQSHKTTLIFTNTRSGTERVVHFLKEKFPENYNDSNVGAHHGSLSKSHRINIENKLKEGKLKVAVSSTSLELGIDIGYIDLVVCLGSPKSVARFLQRAGRAGHKLHETVKARIIVMDIDDLVESSVLMKSAIEGDIDRIHLPKNCLDVLAQQIYGITIEGRIHIDDLYRLIRNSYSFHDLSYSDFDDVIKYLEGYYVSLEERNIYAKIRYNRETGMVSKRGKLARVIYMTNIGTIPDQTGVTVKLGKIPIGKIEEAFLEKLKRNDIFVLGGNTYRFLYAKGQSAFVEQAKGKLPTVPSWFSEMLPLSFDLANRIVKFRTLMKERFINNESEEDIKQFLHNYLYIDEKAANSIYEYFREQFLFSEIPDSKHLLVEHVKDDERSYYVLHTLYGRRVNDTLSRAVAFILSRTHKTDIEISITDNGFMLVSKKNLNIKRAFEILKSEKMELLMNSAIDNTEILRRRFRHCASRSLMILGIYKGKKKRVGRKQISSQILMNAVKRISKDFAILKEARREVLEDAMDFKNTKDIIIRIEQGDLKIKEVFTTIPSPFSLNIATNGYSDIMRIEDKTEFLRRMHKKILAKIALRKDLSEQDKKFLSRH